MSEDLRDEFKRLARDLVDTFRRDLDVTLNYDDESLEYLDGYIARNRDAIREKTGGKYNGLVNVIGAFLGECIIANTEDSGSRVTKARGESFLRTAAPLFPLPKCTRHFPKMASTTPSRAFIEPANSFKRARSATAIPDAAAARLISTA